MSTYEIDHQDQSPPDEELAATESVTVGLPPRLHTLIAWAHRHRVVQPLIQVIEAAHCDQHPMYIGTVLAYLRQPTVIHCLTAWTAERPYLHDIKTLLDACAVSPEVFLQHPPMPKQQAADRQLDGLLARLPVIALLARPPAEASEEESSWLESARAWCFVQHLESVYNGRAAGKYLSTVTDKLRIAIDRDAGWLELVLRLRGPANSISGLTQVLKSNATSLLEDRTGKSSMRPAHRQFLTELRAHCSGKESLSTADESQSQTGLFWRHISTTHQQIGIHRLIPQHAPEIDPEEGTEGHLLGDMNFDEAGEESVVSVVDFDEIDTPPVQARKSQGVLLSTVEDQQFLRYSWNRPNAKEAAVLDQWIESVWTTPDHPDSTIALSCWLALKTAHSIRTVTTLQISEEITDDWCLNPKDWSLVRRPPKRYNGWAATGKKQQWLRPRTNGIQVRLPGPARDLLEQLALEKGFQNGVLEDLLPRSREIEARFNEICSQTSGLERLLSGMLRQHLAQQIFEHSTDATLAQLLASHPRSGLPGNCAYASYSMAEVSRALATTTKTQILGDPDKPGEINAAGSELDPLDVLLASAFRDALARVETLSDDPNQWIAHHNALVGYCTVALLSATGARPVTSPFEALLHFELEQGLLFVDDKHTNAQHQGRLVPLPIAATRLIRGLYLPHLARLSQIVGRFDPLLATRIHGLTLGQERQALPLFFFLASVPALSWVEVSETTLDALELFDWPLPWNLMRHRLSTRLHHLSISQEIVDGLLGHSEQGTAAYSHFSTRTFSDDVAHVKPTLDSLYGDLAIGMPDIPTWPVEDAVPVDVHSTQISEQPTAVYGASARRVRRKQEHDQARGAAQHEIELFINGRPIESIDREAWDSLSRSMLLLPTGMPHSMGSLRYQTLLDWLNDRWKDNAARPRLRRRYLPVLEEPSLFTELSVRAPALVSRALSAIEPLRSIHISRISLRPARLLGCLSLILEARINDTELIKDAAAAKNVRLVKFEDQIYLEHTAGLDQWPDAAARRFWIPDHTARWLDRSWETRSHLDLTKPQQSSLLSPIFEAADRDPKHTSPLVLLEHFCKVVRQENAMTLPGFVAAFLSGQVVSAALHHQDWLRAVKGHAATIHKDAEEAVVTEANSTEPSASDTDDDMEVCVLDTDDGFTLNTAVILPTKSRTFDEVKHSSPLETHARDLNGDTTAVKEDLPTFAKIEAQRSAHRFFKDIRTVINKHSRKASSPRRDLDSALRKLIQESNDVSPTCRLLGEWTRSLLWRRTRKGLLRLSSVDRYLNALSGCFEAEAFDHNLFDADAEDLTNLYSRLLEARRLTKVSSIQPSNSTSEFFDDQDRTSESYRTWRLAANLLRDFHRMCARELSLEDPDWSEFMGTDVPLSISPGFILEKEYFHALGLLVGDAKYATYEALASGFLLLLTCRFGLRGKEAAGLMRTDWVTAEGGSVVVLVRSNRLRVLKTAASRRQVPLLFKLSELEQNIIDRFLSLWVGISGGDNKVPLFCNPLRPSEIFDDVQVRSDLSRLIKQATCNDRLSLHHARHSFANQIARYLFHGARDCWPHGAVTQVEERHAMHVRSLLLSTADVTRRSAWALARLLGHAHPKMTFKSYLHLVPDVAGGMVRSQQSQNEARRQFSKLSMVVDLNQATAVEHYLKGKPPTQVDQPPVSLQALLRFLFLYQQGSSGVSAAQSTGLPAILGEEVISALESIDQTLAQRPLNNPLLSGQSRLLSHIPAGRWKYWIEHAANAQQVITSGALSQTNGELIRMLAIGPSRHILLYKEEHFEAFRKLVDLWALRSVDFTLVGTRGLHPILSAWATNHGFELNTTPSIKKSGTIFQIDALSEGTPPMAIKHRCAAIISGDTNASLKSSFELALLTLTGMCLLEKSAYL